MPRLVGPSEYTRTRVTLRFVQRSILALALAGCSEASTTRPVAELKPEQELGMLALIPCVANARERSIRCGDDALTAQRQSASTLPGRARPDLILGGQNSYVKLTSSNVSYAGELFSFDATVTNLLDQPIGTSDGYTVDPNGIRVFFESPPQTLTGIGTIDYTNPVGGGSLVDGFATFTQSNQAFVRYSEMLATNQTSLAHRWRLHVPSTVESFQFFVYVNAPVRFGQGTQRVVVVQEPVGGVTNELFSPAISVKIVGATGVTLAGYTGSVSVMLGPGSPDGATLGGTLTQTAINGVATFTDFRVIGTGTFRLLFIGAGTVPEVTAPFIVSATASPAIAFQRVTSAGTPIPVDLQAVRRSIDVVLHTRTAGAAELFLASGSSCATHVVGSNDVAVGSAPTPAGPSLVTLTVNTAQLTAGKLPVFLDGNYCLKARLHESGGDSYANALPVTLSNGSTFFADLAFSGPSGVGYGGRVYNSGDLTVTVTPVNYTPVATPPIATITVQLGYGPRLVTLSPIGGSASFSGVYSSTSVGANSIKQYGTLDLAGDPLIVSSAVNTNGVTVSNNDLLSMLQIDNASPNAPVLAAGEYAMYEPSCVLPHGLPCTDYVAGNYAFSASATSGGDYAGKSPTVSLYGVRANDAGFVALGPTGGLTAAECVTTGWTMLPDASSLPSTGWPLPPAYRLRRFETDVIGNVRCTDYPSPFSVDAFPPIIALTTGARTGSVVGQNAIHTYLPMDTVSGFIGGGALFYAADISILRNFSTCVNPTGVQGTVHVAATPSNGCIAQTSGYQLNITPGAEGYHTVTARAIDRAANRSAPLVNTVLYDNTVPAVQGISIPASLVGATSPTFTATATDNVDLRAATLGLVYSTVTLGIPANDYGPSFDATRVTSSAVSAIVPLFIAQLQTVNGSGALNPLNTATDVAQAAIVRVVDAANNAASGVEAISGNVTPLPAFTQLDVTTFQVTTPPVTLSNGGGGGAQQTALTASAVISVGLPHQALLPFAQLCFYYQVNLAAATNAPFAIGTSLPVGCVPNPSVIDNPALGTREYIYTLSGFNPLASLGTSGSVNIIAIGTRANGSGVVTNASSAITLQP